MPVSRHRNPRLRFLPHRAFVSLALAVFSVQHPPTALATAKSFIGPDNTLWSTASNWSPSGVPVNGDDVTLGNFAPGTPNVTLLYTNTYTSPGLNSLTINPTAITGNFTLSQTVNGTSIVATSETIGSTTGRAFYTQSTGTNTITTNSLTLGSSSTASGNYNLSGNATLSAPFEIVGSAGNGIFTQTGGTNSVTAGTSGGFMFVGGTGSSTYSLNGGALNFSNASLVVGINALATFNQSVGNVTFSAGPGSELELAANPAGTGNYTLTSGSISGATKESIGVSGTGIFNQNGGSHSLASGATLFIGENGVAGSFNSHGTYNLSNGTLTADFEIVGNSGTGAFNQTGGTNAVGTLTLAALSNGVGNYTLSNGTLAASQIIINANSTFTQNGGTLNATAITQSGGTIAGTLQNQGSFTYNSGLFSGRLNNSGTVTFNPDFTAGNGILNTSDFTIPDGRTVSTNGQGLDNESSFTIDGGTLSGAGPLINNAFFSAWGTISGTAGFTNNLLFTQGPGNILFANTGANINSGNISLASGRQFQLLSGVLLSNAGSFFLNGAVVNGAGSLTNTAGATLTGPGLITVPILNTGIVQPGNGALTISTPWTNNGIIQLTSFGSTLNGGAVSNPGFIQGIGNLNVNVTNTGTIEAAGGALLFSNALTNAVNGTLRTTTGTELLILGSFPTNAGLIDLAGGTFDNGNHTLNNTGTITGFGVLSTGGGGGLTNNGNITFTGGTSTINGPVTNTANQTINIKFQPALFTGTVTNNANATIKTTNTTATFTGNFINNGNFISDPSTNIFFNITNAGLISGGPGDVITISPSGSLNNTGTFTNGGTLNANGNITNSGTFTQTGPQNWSATSTFTNNAPGIATFGSNAKLANLTINGGAVDITTSKFIIEPTPLTKSTTLSTLQSYITSNALISSTLPSNFGLALIDNAVTNFPTFGGNPADSNSLLLSPELLGDADADGTVNLTDLATILNNFGQSTIAWTSGNFDNANTIDLTDLADVLNNFGQSNPNASITQPTIPTPEPASLVLFLLGSALLRRAVEAR